MEPTHTIDYELTSEMATDITRALARFEIRRGWRRDLHMFLGAAALGMLVAVPVLGGWMSAGVGGALLGLVTLWVLGAVYGRRWLAHAAATTAVIALHTPDRHVRIEFFEQRVRMEAEFFRGEGAWTELDEIVVFPGFWALFFSNRGQIVIPGPFVSPELQTFLRAKAEHVMAPVLQG